MRVLLADDDAAFRHETAAFLAANGVKVEPFDDIEQLDAALDSGPPGLVLLDLGLGIRLGVGFLRHLLRARTCPSVVVSTTHSADDRAASLQLGADAYLDKAVGQATILATLRGLAEVRDHFLAETSQRWCLDVAERFVAQPDGERVRLTSTEFDLLCVLHARQGCPVDRATLFGLVFRRPYNPMDRAVDTLVSKLRTKLAASGAGRPLILTVRSSGYVFTGFPGGG